jgi:hypothetical protein
MYAEISKHNTTYLSVTTTVRLDCYRRPQNPVMIKCTEHTINAQLTTRKHCALDVIVPITQLKIS